MSLLIRVFRPSSIAGVRRSLPTLFRRYSSQSQQPQYQSPTPPSSQPSSNAHRDFYKRDGLGRTVAFNFLVAMATFQALYWGWLKLESMEVKSEKGKEMESLETQLKALTGKKEG